MPKRKSERKRTTPNVYSPSPTTRRQTATYPLEPEVNIQTDVCTPSETSPSSPVNTGQSLSNQYVTADALQSQMDSMFNFMLEQTNSVINEVRHMTATPNPPPATPVPQLPGSQMTAPPLPGSQMPEPPPPLPGSHMTAPPPQLPGSHMTAPPLPGQMTQNPFLPGSLTPTGNNFETVVNSTIPVGAHLKPSVRCQIINNIFLDNFRVLLPVKPGKKKEGEADAFSLKRDPNTNAAVWVPVEPQNTSKISLPEWARAWNIFQAVYIQSKNLPSLSFCMAKHCEQVLALAAESYDWRSYDEGFRRLITAGSVSWGQVHLELLTDAKSRRTGFDSLSPFPSYNAKSSRAGFAGFKGCFLLRSTGACDKINCPYIHSLPSMALP